MNEYIKIAIRGRQAQKFTCLLASFAQSLENKSRVVATKPSPVCPVSLSCRSAIMSPCRYNGFRLSCQSRHVL